MNRYTTGTVTNTNAAAYERFLEAHPNGHFLQSIHWGAQKPAWKWQGVVAMDETGDICGAMALLLRKAPIFPLTLLYAPRGPVCDRHDRALVTALMDAAAAVAKLHGACVLKLDPDIPDSELNFDHVQPQYVVRLPLVPDAAALLAGMHQKTRYNIRLAQRRGVQVRLGAAEDIPAFYRLMAVTGTRDGFSVRPEAYFKNLLTNLEGHARLYMAEYAGLPIAGAISVTYGKKCWYVYGASSDQHRNTMPNYLLQWTMLLDAAANGCTLYDFRGISGDDDPANPLYGLYRFKRGWGGTKVCFAGEFNRIYRPIAYRLLQRLIALRRKLRRWLARH